MQQIATRELEWTLEANSAQSNTMLLMSLGLLNVLDVKIGLGLLLISLLIFDFWKSKNAPNFPPGPWSLPFLGNVFVSFNYRAMDEVEVSILFLSHALKKSSQICFLKP